jgi:hypothetical protein
MVNARHRHSPFHAGGPYRVLTKAGLKITRIGGAGADHADAANNCDFVVEAEPASFAVVGWLFAVPTA